MPQLFRRFALTKKALLPDEAFFPFRRGDAEGSGSVNYKPFQLNSIPLAMNSALLPLQPNMSLDKFCRARLVAHRNPRDHAARVT